ncbi:hypothetical protein RUM43_003760 [Polyplax serrata]|uniref:Uncharacterized protein n=1 Tax=Polyplax serrata TaxID=468196 RepID=A0AAN8NVY6_POLSC
MATSKRDVDDFCRLCAVESQSGVIIYSSEGEDFCLEEKIISCLRIEVSRDDMLPKRVCQSCNVLLEDYYRFSERAKRVQQSLYFLLGLHLPFSPEGDPELSMIDDGVKIESNIKKEMDEFIFHQSNFMKAESPKIELSVTGDILLEENTHYCSMSNAAKQICNVSNANVGIGSALSSNNNVEASDFKELHRRRMLIPKVLTHDEAKQVNPPNEINCIIENSEECEHHFHNQMYRNQSVCQGSTKGDCGVEQVHSVEEEQENKKMALEWKKKWGILCNQCEIIFHDRCQFDSHYRSLHNRQPMYTCSVCQKSHGEHSDYRFHIFEHINNGRFKCKFCSKQFCGKEMLEIHLQLLHSEMKIHICEDCGKSFTTQLRLNLHRKKHIKQTSVELQCSECGKILQTKGGLATHKSVHKLGRHFMCHICGKTFTQKINMQQHVKHHKAERPYICDICNKSFIEKSHLNRHKSFHTDERLFQCPVCQKTYKTERCLKVHSQLHWNFRPYVCSFCGKGFLSSTKLKQHHNCHTGERPFACKYCEKTFTNYPNWMKHTRRRHKVDHKTGLSLKEEYQAKVPTATEKSIEIPEAELKEDCSNSIPTEFDHSQLQVAPEDKNRHRMNFLPQ